MQYLDAISKTTEWSLFPRQTIQYTVIQVYTPTNNAEEAEVEQFYVDLQDFLELTPKKDVLFIIGDWNAKVGSQEIPGVTGKFGLGVQNEAGQRLTEFSQENALVIANTLFQQHKRRLYTWTSPDGQYENQIYYILCSWRWRSSLYSQQKQDRELTVAKIMNSLLPNSDLNWRKYRNTRPFRKDLNQILYDYTVEVTDRFKGLDLIDKTAWRTMDGGLWHCTGGRDQDHPQRKEMRKGKMVVWGGLTNSCGKKRS